MSGFRRALPWLGCIMVGMVAMAAAQGGEPVQGPAPFRRIFVPADEITQREWRGNYLPIESAEFEQLLETVADHARGLPTGMAARVEHAEYDARLLGEDVLVGTALLTLVRRDAEPAVLTLEPCSLALASATWHDADQRPAVMGTGPDGRVRVLVESRQLKLQWSLRGERTASGAVSFSLDLPRTPMARLSIETTRGIEIQSDRGLLSRTASGQGDTWRVDLGGQNSCRLRAVSEALSRERRPLTLVRQSLMYEFSARGINLLAQLRIDVHGEPLQRIALDLDPTLQLTSARYGEQNVPWSATTDPDLQLTHVVLQMPEALAGSGRVLQLTAMAPLSTGQTTRLPGVRPQGMSWQEGTATLLIPSSLVLEQLSTEGCRQSRVAALPIPLSGESVEIQFYRPGAQIDVKLSEPREQLKIDTGTVIDLGIADMVGREIVQVGLTRGARHTLQFDVLPDWTIDAVDDLATKRPLEWELDEPTAGGMQLKIKLESPLTPDRPLRLAVRGHRATPAQGQLLGKQLSLLDFPAARSGVRLMSVQATEGNELRWQNSQDLVERDALTLLPAELQLFAPPPSGTVLLQDAAFARGTLVVERRKPSYSAEVRIDAVIQREGPSGSSGGPESAPAQQTLTETYTVHCVPDAARVERLLVHFSQARETPLEWNLAGGNSGQFSARRISAGEQAQRGLPPGGETWELSLHLARPGAFELRAVRSIPFAGELPLALVSVADAASQRGSLTIRALGDADVAIQNRRLTPVPPELVQGDRFQTARAAYRYQPTRDDLGREPAITLTPTSATANQAGAWVWSHQLDSRFAIDGTVVHHAAIRIQTSGQQQFTCRLPADASLIEARIDDRRLLPGSGAPADTPLLVDLPPGRRFATLWLDFTTTGRLPTLAASVQPSFAELSIPTVSCEWRLWTPAGYEVCESGPMLSHDAIQRLNWRERVFGLLGRKTDASMFNPFSWSDWRSIVAGDDDARAADDTASQFLEHLGTAADEMANAEAISWGQLLTSVGEVEAQFRREVLVDSESLLSLGITAQTPVAALLDKPDHTRGQQLLDQTRLVVLTLPRAVVVTSRVAAAALSSQLAPASADGTQRVLPGPLAQELEQALLGIEPGARFLSVDRWRATGDQGQGPWNSPTSWLSDTESLRNWHVYGVRMSADAQPSIEIVHRTTVRSLAWAIFFLVIGLGSLTWALHGRMLALWGTLAAALALIVPAAYAPLASAMVLAILITALAALLKRPEPPPRADDRSTRTLYRSAGSSQALMTSLLCGMTLLLVNALQGAQLKAPAGTSPGPATSSNGAASSTVPNDRPSSPVTPAVMPQAAATLNANETLAPAAADAKLPVASNVKSGPQALPRPVYQVFVPTNEERQPVGHTLYVPEAFYRQLHQQSAAAKGQPEGWLIRRALYQGTLSRERVNKRLGISQFKATFEIMTFQPQITVRLPLSRDALASSIGAARLEGRTIPLAWNEAGNELLLELAEPQTYSFELDLHPAVRADAVSAGFELPIPPLASALLELSLPTDAPAIELPTARGEARLLKDRGILSAELGATDRLVARWPLGIGMEAASPNVEVDELVWMKVRPGTTVLDVHFKYRATSNPTRQVRLLADPRLRLLPSVGNSGVVTAVHATPGDPQKIDVELARDIGDGAVVELSFLVTGTSGVGNLRLPRIESSGARATKRWLGVTVDPALQPKVQAGEDSKSVDISEFLAAWGPTEARLQAAYSIPRGEPLWILASQPNEPQIVAEQTLALSASRNESLVQFEATLSVSGGYVFQFALEAPPRLTVEQVSLLDEGVQRVARWSADANGRITVFLTAATTGRQMLTLQGRWSGLQDDVLSVPHIQLLGAETRRRQVHLYRQPSILADVEKSPGISAADATDIVPRDNFGAWLGAFNVDDPRAEIKLRLAPNAPKAQAVAITTLERSADRWGAEFDYRVSVSEGLVDTLQFDIPPQLVAPLKLDPPAPFKIVSKVGGQRRTLVVSPEKPIAGNYQLKIRGRITPFSSGVPDIMPLGIEQLDRYIALPNRVESQGVTWDTEGLASAPLPPTFAALPGTQDASVYRVAGEHFQAVLKASQRPSAQPRARLVDILLIWQPDGSRVGLAAFEIEPAGANHSVVEMPVGSRLLHATVGSLPAVLQSSGERRWKIDLGPRHLPQRVEVLFSLVDQLPRWGSNRQASLPAPQLVDVPVERTLWTIYMPRPLGQVQGANSDWQSTATAQQMVRLRSIVELVQLPAETVGEHAPEEISRWYRAWRNRYTAARTQLLEQLPSATSGGERNEDLVKLSAWDKRITAVDASFGTGEVEPRGSVTPPTQAQLLAMQGQDLVPLRLAAAGRLDAVQVRFPHASADSAGWRWLAGIALLGAVLALAYATRHRSLPAMDPWLLAALVALGWWLWLAPSVLGFLALVAIGWLAFQKRRHFRTLTQPL